MHPIFEIFASARRYWGWAFGWKVSGAQAIYFCNARVKTVRIDNIWNFATFNMYTVPAKMIHLQKYSTDFRNLCLNSKMLRVGILVGKFQERRYFTFALATWKLWASRSLEILPLSTCTLCQQKSSPKVFNRFSKSLPQLEDVVGGHLGEKFQVRRYFTFAMPRWKFCASTTIEILTLSTSTLCQQKSHISKIFTRFSKCAPQLEDVEGGHFGWKVFGAQVFYFCNGKVKTLRIDNICNFATFNLYNVSAKILYLQRYSTDFRNLGLSSKMLWGGGHFVEKFQVRRYFTFAMPRWKFCASTTNEILPLSTCTLCQQKSYISKGIQPIFEICASARRCWGWAFGWKHSLAQLFYFCNGKVKTLLIDTIWNFATFNLYTVPAKILYLQSYSTDFRNLSLSS